MSKKKEAPTLMDRLKKCSKVELLTLLIATNRHDRGQLLTRELERVEEDRKERPTVRFSEAELCPPGQVCNCCGKEIEDPDHAVWSRIKGQGVRWICGDCVEKGVF